MDRDIIEICGSDLESPVEAIEKCYELGWTDGLPVVPPTEGRVRDFLNHVQMSGDEVVGLLRERRRAVTVGKIAANAVMAGCQPEYLPVVLAATEAMLSPEFNLIGPSSSLGGAAVLAIVNGPVAREIKLNSGNNLFGPGNRANSTIGRAIRLVLMNCCAAIPGLFDRSVLGHPGKFSFCIAENETGIHWDPLHVERGYDLEQSVVTVFACGAPRQLSVGEIPDDIISSVADVIMTPGTSISSLVAPNESMPEVGEVEVAVVVAGRSDIWEKWSKQDFRNGLRLKLKKSLADLKKTRLIDGEIEEGDHNRFFPLMVSPEDILVMFAGGGESQMCAVMPSWGPKVSSNSVTKAIKAPSK